MREKLNVTIRDRRKPKMREMPHTQKTKNGRKLTLWKILPKQSTKGENQECAKY